MEPELEEYFKLELVDMSPAVSAFRAQQTSLLLYSNISKISHDTLLDWAGAKGSNAKGPDMKVWSKGKGLEKASTSGSVSLK